MPFQNFNVSPCLSYKVWRHVLPTFTYIYMYQNIQLTASQIEVLVSINLGTFTQQDAIKYASELSVLSEHGFIDITNAN